MPDFTRYYSVLQTAVIQLQYLVHRTTILPHPRYVKQYGYLITSRSYPAPEYSYRVHGKSIAPYSPKGAISPVHSWTALVHRHKLYVVMLCIYGIM